MALAMNSTPTEKLQNTCAGVTEGSTFNETVKIREVVDGQLELVFDEDDGYQGHYKKLRPGKQYGGVPGEKDAAVTYVRTWLMTLNSF